MQSVGNDFEQIVPQMPLANDWPCCNELILKYKISQLENQLRMSEKEKEYFKTRNATINITLRHALQHTEILSTQLNPENNLGRPKSTDVPQD